MALNIEEEIIIQKGYSLYKCKNIRQEYEMLTFQEMNLYIESSEIIVTHGGPGSIFLPLSLGKNL
ncbi:glycosyltransferase [Exiguobacterium artemiae]